MFLWFALIIFAAALMIGSLIYLVTRVRRFSFMRKLAENHKALSWLLSAAMVGFLFLFALISPYAVVIVVLHLAIFWLLSDFAAWIIRKIRKREPKRYLAGIAAIFFTAVYLLIGWNAAHSVRQTSYTVSTEKNVPPLRIALIADCHLGITLSSETFEKEMDRIQAVSPDLVVIAGDFVDNDSKKADIEEACRALGKLRTTYGVFFVFGNHDNGYSDNRDYNTSDLRNALIKNSVQILEDETVYLNDATALIGRKDRSMRDRMTAEELLQSIDPGIFTIIVNHQPNDYDAESKAGADLVLSGHTHGGHIFPAGQLGLLFGANDALYGLSRIGDTSFIVTSGISGWGIPFKTGTFSEFVIIDIDPANG